MNIEIANKWPLMMVPVPQETALQKELAADLPSQNPQDPIILNNRVGPESDTFWEKGAFIDIYI